MQIIDSKDNRFEIYKNNTGKDYDKRTRFEIYTDLKKEDPNVVIVRPEKNANVAYDRLSPINFFLLSLIISISFNSEVVALLFK